MQNIATILKKFQLFLLLLVRQKKQINLELDQPTQYTGANNIHDDTIELSFHRPTSIRV